MLGNLLSALLGGDEAESGPERLRLAVAALLVEVARMDDVFVPAERSAIIELLAARFGLDRAAATQLLTTAERVEADAADAYRFTREIAHRMTPSERIAVIEMMWEVAYADGRLDPDEDALLRRVAGLLDVDDHARGEARHRVLARRQAAGAIE